MSDFQKPTIKNRDVVFVGFPFLYPIGSNSKDLSLQFEKENRILYVNIPLSGKDFKMENPPPHLQNRIDIQNGLKPGLSKIGDHYWILEPRFVTIPHNGIKFPFLFDFINWINNKRYAGFIAEAIKELGFKDIIIFSDQSIYHSFYLKEFLKPDWFIYYERDYLQGVDYFKHHGSRLEPKIIGKSDIVLNNSTFLQEFTSKYNPNSYFVGQGCDLSLFDYSKDYALPEDLRNLNRPIIGYVGALVSHRLDIDLLIHIAKANSAWSLVLVGPEDEVFESSELHLLPNVYFFGIKSVDVLPGFIKHFDVCINPQIMNPVTIGNYPRKIDEYLAIGKPVVALKTVAMKDFENYSYLAITKEEFVSQIIRALKENTPELEKKRSEFAGQHTWENSFQLILMHFLKKMRKESQI